VAGVQLLQERIARAIEIDEKLATDLAGPDNTSTGAICW
jgi:hypothetical protein